MESFRQFPREEKWSPGEKKVARRAYDKAFERQCATITKEAARMLEMATSPSDLWRVHDHLSKQRDTVDRNYDYRYSKLLIVFAVLMREGWLAEADLAGIDAEKITEIKFMADIG